MPVQRLDREPIPPGKIFFEPIDHKALLNNILARASNNANITDISQLLIDRNISNELKGEAMTIMHRAIVQSELIVSPDLDPIEVAMVYKKVLKKEKDKRDNVSHKKDLVPNRDESAEIDEKYRLIMDVVSQGFSVLLSNIQTGTGNGMGGNQFHGESDDFFVYPFYEQTTYSGAKDQHEGKFNSYLFAAVPFFRETEKIKALGSEGVYETVVISEATKNVELTVSKPVIKKQLFRSKTVMQEERVVTQEPASMSEIVKGGTDEGATVLVYYANSIEGAFEDFHRNFARRPGNYLYFQLFIPQSLAVRISETMKNDPVFVRKLVDSYVRNKYSPKFVADEWDKYTRPPYDTWDRNLGVNSKMLIVDRLKEPDMTIKSRSEIWPHVVSFKPVGTISDPSYTSEVV